MRSLAMSLLILGVVCVTEFVYAPPVHAAYNEFGFGAWPGIFTKAAGGQVLTGAEYTVVLEARYDGEPDWTVVNNPTTGLNFDIDPYIFTKTIVYEGCAVDYMEHGQRLTITQTKAPAGYQIDSTPRSIGCSATQGWIDLSDGNIHYIMQPALVVATPSPPILSSVTTGLLIPDTSGIEYLINGIVYPAGALNLSYGTYTVTVRAKDGYVLAEGATATWQITIPDNRPTLADTGISQQLATATAGGVVALGACILTILLRKN